MQPRVATFALTGKLQGKGFPDAPGVVCGVCRKASAQIDDGNGVVTCDLH